MNYYIYILKRPCGTPFYVGKGKGNRCKIHLQGWHIKNDANRYKTNIIKKIRSNGNEPIIEIIRKNLSEMEAFNLEREMISLYKRKSDGGILSNMSDGGEGQSGFKHSKYTKKLISEKTKGELNGFFGKSHTKESLLKIGNINRGKILNYEWRKKLSDATIGKPFSDEHRKKISNSLTGYKKSKEHIQKIADAQRGKTIPDEQIAKIKLTMENRKLLGLPIGRPKKKYNMKTEINT